MAKKEDKKLKASRGEGWMRIPVGIVSGIIIYIWAYLICLFFVINFIYRVISGKTLKELASMSEVWNIQNWGSPDINKVFVQPNLNKFIAKCKEYDIKVGLSSWYRKDTDNTRMKITSAEKHAEIWIRTLQTIEKDGLMNNILAHSQD